MTTPTATIRSNKTGPTLTGPLFSFAALIAATFAGATPSARGEMVQPPGPSASQLVVVHYFAPHLNGLAVGHVSMTLPDGTYISWSPEVRRPAALAVVNRTLAQDIAAEAEQPIDFPETGVDAARVEVWWEGFRQSNKYWMASGPNCTTVVEAALAAGGMQDVPDAREVWYPAAFLPFLNRTSQPEAVALAK